MGGYCNIHNYSDANTKCIIQLYTNRLLKDCPRVIISSDQTIRLLRLTKFECVRFVLNDWITVSRKSVKEPFHSGLLLNQQQSPTIIIIIGGVSNNGDLCGLYSCDYSFLRAIRYSLHINGSIRYAEIKQDHWIKDIYL